MKTEFPTWEPARADTVCATISTFWIVPLLRLPGKLLSHVTLSHSLTSRTGRERETRLFLWKLNSCVQRTLSCLLCLVVLHSFLTDRINVLEVKEDKDGTIYLQTLQQ